MAVFFPPTLDSELSLEQALHESVFMTSLSPDPGHRIHLCWEQQCHLLPEVSAYSAKTVTKWTTEEVRTCWGALGDLWSKLTLMEAICKVKAVEGILRNYYENGSVRLVTVYANIMWLW